MFAKRIIALSLFAIIGLCGATVPAINATQATASFLCNPIFAVSYLMDAFGDILVTHIYPATVNSVNILRRGNDGQYTVAATLNSENNVPYTNGEWVAVLDYNADPIVWNLYNLDNSTGVPMGPKKTVTSSGATSAAFFPGNVLVGEGRAMTNSFDLYTYTDNWAYHGSVDMGDHVVMTSDYVMSRDRNFVVTTNQTHIDIWKFDGTGPTFQKTESFAYDNQFNIIGIYNGLDTVVLTNYGYTNSSGAFGRFQVYTKNKSTGEWTITQTVSALALGLRGTSSMGRQANFIGQNQFAVTAYLENAADDNHPSPSGKVIIFSRTSLDDGTWNETLQITASDTDDVVSFGTNAVMNQYNELLIPGFNLNNDADPSYTGYIFSAYIEPLIITPPMAAPESSPITDPVAAPVSGPTSAAPVPMTPVKTPVKVSSAAVVEFTCGVLMVIVLAL